MKPIRILSDADVRHILDMKAALEAVERAYVLKARQEARVFPMISEDIIPGRAEMDIKSGMLDGESVFGMKLVSWFGDNVKQGLPAITGLSLLFDLHTGFPKGILNAGYITGMRTGAAGALGVKHLARPGSTNLMVVGTGGMAVFQIAAALTAVPTLNTVHLYDPMDYENAVAFRQKLHASLENIPCDLADFHNIHWKERIEAVTFTVEKDPAKALDQCDAVITITPSRKPLLQKEWIRPGTHLSCVGADALGKQEVDEGILADARVFVDDIQQASTLGETQTAVRSGLIGKDALTEIGDVIAGKAPGRQTDQEITLFDSTGISLQDLAVANYVLEKAEALSVGFRHRDYGTVAHL